MTWKQWNLFLNRDDLETERQQCVEEGRDIAPLEAEFDRLMASDLDEPKNQKAALELLDRTPQLPTRPDFPHREPSDLAGIHAERPASPPSLPSISSLSESAHLDKIHGAWLGRCAGCLLGKPLEGAPRARLWGYLEATDNWPLHRYMAIGTDESIRKQFDLQPNRAWIDEIDCMAEDDDLNYTLIGLEVMKRHGRDFTSEHIADYWFWNLPMGHAFTAERVALRNLALCIGPPASALHRNPYREWIGAQIRADFFGYAAPGDPERAADYAHRDASISHVKNGIYGEIWVAAMLAAAAVTDDFPTILQAGLAQIPEHSRLTAAVREVMAWHAQHVDYDDAVERIHAQWADTRIHDLIHTISNAMIVVAGLLWGELDFEKSICRAVQPGFDTDCNGATVGSIVGMVLGAKALPAKWIDPLSGTLITGIAGRQRASIRDLATDTLQVIRNNA